jgi:stearoyl-CoA 9-desaturase NADPH oxidoreductase
LPHCLIAERLVTSTLLTPTPTPNRWLDRLIDPSVFDFFAGQIHPLWTWSRPLARIVARRQVSRTAVTLRLQANRHGAGGLPGQHLNLGVQIDGRWVQRSYSLSAAPDARRCFEVTVQQVDGGRVSTHLCQQARVGDMLTIGAAFGTLTLPPSPPQQWLFLAAGSGITPFLGLVRALLAQARPANIRLIVWARSQDDVCQLKELQWMAQGSPHLVLQIVTTRQPAAARHRSHGRLSAELLRQLLPAETDLGSTRVYACGPGGFVSSARQLLADQVQHFDAEAFSPESTPAPVTAGHTTVQVHLRRSGRSVSVPTGQALLPALEAQGLNPPSGCRMGICRSCVCTRLGGSTQDLQTAERDDQPGAALRLCVSRACTDLTLDL